MKYYSTNDRNLRVSLEEAVVKGLAPSNGLFMPDLTPRLPQSFFSAIQGRSHADIAFDIAANLLGDDIPPAELRRIVHHTVDFDVPVVKIEERIFALELFHGPTLAFKDFGARFMSGVLQFLSRKNQREVIVLVATSGDTGSAVANGFLGVNGVRVVILYPSGKVSEMQEKQFTTLGQNITAIEIDGTFDDCQRLVKTAFADSSLNERLFLTSANSINIARLIPQSFYYFFAFAQMADADGSLVFSVPSGNFGNLTAGVLAQRMGLPVQHFVASTNANDVVPQYLNTQQFTPRPSTQTISNAMDVGNPSNFARLLDLFENNHAEMSNVISGYSFSDDQTKEAIRTVFQRAGYTLDPHGAVGYLGLKEFFKNGKSKANGVFLETAHPAKFQETVEHTLQRKIDVPEGLKKFLTRTKKSRKASADFNSLKEILVSL